MIEVALKKTSSSDIIPLTAGEHKTPSGHKYGPYVRDCSIIHFCLSGKGVLRNERGEHEISAGELFVIRDGELTTYVADSRDPWHYVWISFIGNIADELAALPDVLRVPKGISERILELVRCGEVSPEIYISVLYELLHHTLKREQKEPQDKITELKRYIKYEYMKDITAGGLARRFGFDRSHLYRVFKARYGMGIKEYLTEVRMGHAEALLKGGFRVSDTAYMVGYRDEFNFSKAYSKYFGYPPSKARHTK